MKPKKNLKPRGMLMYWILVAAICLPPIIGHFVLVAPADAGAQAATDKK
jgi:hypothetical protein